MPDRGVDILNTGQRPENQPEYFVQHPMVCLPLLIQQLRRNIQVVVWTWQGSDHYNGVRGGHLVDLRR
jgi:hypothetical protein